MMWFCGVYVAVVCDVGGFVMWFCVVYVVVWVCNVCYCAIKRFVWILCYMLW